MFKKNQKLGFLDILNCPECASKLNLEKVLWRCSNCQSSGLVDDVGVVHLTSEDFYYREIAREKLAPLLTASKKSELYKNFKKVLSGLSNKNEQYLAHYALDQRRGAIGVLAKSGPGTTVLDFGSGWGNIAKTVSNFGGRVVSMDMTYESLRFARLNSNNPNQELHIKAGRKLPLPFQSNVFDSVILNGVLEWLPEGNLLNQDPASVQAKYLKEIKRILKPGGSIVVGIENRFSFLYFSGVKEDHTALRFGALLPRQVSNLYSKLFRKKPYRTYTYSYFGYKKILKNLGFNKARFMIPWLRYRGWSHLFRLNRFKASVIKTGKTTGWQRLVGRLLLEVGGLFKANFVFVPDFYILANKPGSSNSLNIIEKIGKRGKDKAIDFAISNPQRVRFNLDDKLIKVPLDKKSEELLEKERRILSEVKEFASDYLLDTNFRKISNTLYSETKRLKLKEDSNLQEKIALEFLEAKDCQVQLKEFKNTQTALLLSRDMEADLKLVSGQLKRKLRQFNGEVLVGRTHGDFHPENILIDTNNKGYVIDWDFYEENSLIFLDPLHYIVKSQMGEFWQAKNFQAVFSSRVIKQSKMWKIFEHTSKGLSLQIASLVYLLDRVRRGKTRSDINYFYTPGKTELVKALRIIDQVKD